MHSKSVRTAFWTAGSFVLGLLLGNLTSSIFDRSIELSENLVRLKCIYSLSEDYKVEKGMWPKNLTELQAWCEKTPVLKQMFARTKRPYSNSFASEEWQLVLDEKEEFAGFKSKEHSALHHDYEIKPDGSISASVKNGFFGQKAGNGKLEGLG